MHVRLTDIRFVHVVRAVCFFYFCCFLPFIWIGRCVVWRFFKDTEEKKAKAEQEVLLRAKKKGKMEKYGIIDLATELKKMEEDTEGKTSGKKDDDQSVVTQALVMNIDYSAVGKSENVEEAKASVKNDKESNKKQMVVDGGIQNQTASPQFNWRTEKETRQRKNATSHIEKRKGRRERESKGERGSVNKSNMKGPKQKTDGTKFEAQNGSQQMNLSAEKDKRDTREKRVKVRKREMASDRKVDREKEQKGNQRGHKYRKYLQTHSQPADHWMRENLSHTASEHTHPLSSQSSHASRRGKDSVHIQNSGEMESCRESLNKASDHSYHSGSEAGSDNASEHSNLQLNTSHGVPCASSHSDTHHSAPHTNSQCSVHSQLCQKSSISKHSDSRDTCKSGSESHSSNGDANHDEMSHNNSDDDGCSNNGSHSGSEDDCSNEGSHNNSSSHSNSDDEGGCSNEGSHSDSSSHSNSDNEGGCSNESSHSDIDSGGEGDEGMGSHSNSNSHSNSRESSSKSEGSTDSETEDNTQSGSVESTNHGNNSQ